MQRAKAKPEQLVSKNQNSPQPLAVPHSRVHAACGLPVHAQHSIHSMEETNEPRRSRQRGAQSAAPQMRIRRHRKRPIMKRVFLSQQLFDDTNVGVGAPPQQTVEVTRSRIVPV